MPVKNIVLTVLIPLLTLLNIQSQEELHESILPEFTGEVLLGKLVEDYKTTSVLDYDEARDVMYGLIDKSADTVACVYSGHKLYLPDDVDPSSFLYMNGSVNGINAEHSFPRSKGADEANGNAYSDLHHLFPVRTGVNTARSNLPFGEIEDEAATHWYFEEEVEHEVPSSIIDAYSEKNSNVFEPREDHKGNLARAMFYFYTMYKSDADEADPIFFESQKEDLCEWHFLDPVDAREWNRTFQISEYQDGIINPFILDCSLATRTFCTNFADCETETTSLNSDFDTIENNAFIFPNPSFGEIEISLNIEENAKVKIQIFDLFGKVVISKKQQNLKIGAHTISLFLEQKGMFICQLVFEAESGEKILNEKIIIE